MPLLPDPAELRAIASRIGGFAGAIRAQADRLHAAVAGVHWHGTAATAFDLLANDVIGGLRASADRLDDAADALRRHASNVEHLIGLLARIGADGLALGGDLVHGVLDEITHPSHLLGDAASVLSGAASLVDHLGGLVGIG